MIAAQEQKYILFDEIKVKWIWTENELGNFREMWNANKPIQEIANAFSTNKRSIALLVIDQAEQKEIKQRDKGLHGEELEKI